MTEFRVFSTDKQWREAGETRYGAFCRNCGSWQHVEADHMKPKGQGGKSHLENLLFLCGAWGLCGGHALKTAGRLHIERSWLEPAQIAYLAEIGWVRWDPETGEVSGNGWRHFAPTEPTRSSMTMTDDEQIIEPDAPTNEPEADPSELDAPDTSPAEPPPGNPNPDDLAAAADAAMADEPEPVQDHLPGTNYAKTKFVGMSFEAEERPDLRQEVAYIVRGVCVGHAEEVMADQDIREVAKVKVTSVERTTI
jgi:hypothetical protein